MDNKKLNIAFALSTITIVYNLIEGGVSVFFGMEDETLALFGFGVDSFVEVISGVGIAHMIIRMKRDNVTSRDKFEKDALRITGFAFYLLAGGLIAGSAINIYAGSVPETTIVGIIVSTISILTMYFLLSAKLKIGRELKSDAIVADANCTKTCFYLSILLLVSSGLYELLRISYIDIAGSLGIAYFAFKEGKEAFEKVKSGNLSCSCDDDCHN